MVTAPDVVATVCRALSIAAALQAVGIVMFLHIFGHRITHASRSIVKLACWSAIAAIVLTLIQHGLGPARMTANFGGALDMSLQAFYAKSEAGLAHGVRIAGLVLLLFGINRLRIGIAGTILVATSFALMGHTVTHEPRWLLAALLFIHLVVIAFWFGSLLPLLAVTRMQDRKIAGCIVDEFSRIAALAVPLILIAGVILAVVLLGSVEKLLEPYGLLVLAKVTGFALLLGLASLNKWRYAPQISAGSAVAIGAFNRSVYLEWALIFLLIAITTTMTGLFALSDK